MTAFYVGPYRYTETDARRTLLPLGDWWDLLERGVDASSIAEQLHALATELAVHLQLPANTPLKALGIAASKAPTDSLPFLVEVALDALTRAAETLRSNCQMPSRQHGTVAQLNASNGGVPKTAVESAAIDFTGLVGDRQRTRFHHGRPWQALCLWSSEVIASFAADGHPVFPGAAGENVTIAGIDWSVVRPGVRFRIGGALCEASLWALPCASNKPWFMGGEFQLMHHERGPVSRMYAAVLEPGPVAVGDDVVLEP